MAFDLAISEHGDVVMAGNRDLAGISGVDLINQRIQIRLRLQRGAWFYDLDERLGSHLHQVIGSSPDSPLQIENRVRDALRPISEISVQEVSSNWDPEGKSIVIFLTYAVLPQPDEIGVDLITDSQQLTVTVALASGR